MSTNYIRNWIDEIILVLSMNFVEDLAKYINDLSLYLF